MKKSLILMACVGVIALAFTACHREDGFSAGSEMSADEVRAYREKLLAETLSEAKPPEATPPSTPSEPVLPSTPSEVTPPEAEGGEDVEDGGTEELPEICYYVANGSVWHASNNCSYIKNSKNVIQDDVEGAQAAGKARPCSKCASNWQ